MRERLQSRIRDVPDFPKPGIVFKDITPILADPETFAATLSALRARIEQAAGERGIDHIAAIESRGFIFGAALADRMGVGFIPLRKPGKLPWKTRRAEYMLEYGSDALEIHTDALAAGERVALVDDLLATGGTAAAAASLLTEMGADLVGLFFVIELAFLAGREKHGAHPADSLVSYAGE